MEKNLKYVQDLRSTIYGILKFDVSSSEPLGIFSSCRTEFVYGTRDIDGWRPLMVYSRKNYKYLAIKFFNWALFNYLICKGMRTLNGAFPKTVHVCKGIRTLSGAFPIFLPICKGMSTHNGAFPKTLELRNGVRTINWASPFLVMIYALVLTQKELNIPN